MTESLEQKSRDLLDRMGVEHSQDFSAGVLVELANMFNRITQLQTEVEALKTELHHSSLAATEEAHEVDRINEELTALRKDAARYQWLRRMSVGLSLSHQVISQFVTNQGELDAVIAKDT